VGAVKAAAMIFKYSSCFLGIILALPILPLVVLGFTLPITPSGIGYLLGGLLVAGGLILAPWMPKYYLAVIIGIILVTLVAAARVSTIANNPTRSLKVITLPQGKETSWLNSLIDEQDSLIFGEAVFHFIGGDSETEHEGITSALYKDYVEMRAAHGAVPSPFLSTYLYLQQPQHFDAVVIEPEVDYLSTFGVIFLHGYMGNVTAQCWEIAQAVKGLGGVTVCPSTVWTGQWWQPQGQSILHSTFEYLRGRGVRQIYLGGFSNGGFGISRLVSQVSKEKELRGLIFIDGIADRASLRVTGLPVLVIQGEYDERMPAAEARRIAETIGAAGTYVELPGDHFLIMKQPELVQNAIATWLENQALHK
jgi:dienelactone hydrolase